MTTRVSIAELAAADIRLRPAEAVALVAEICRLHTEGALRGLPTPGIIRVTRDGEVVVEGPMPFEEGSVAAAAHLLEDLLPDFDAPSAYRAGGPLRLVIARALGTLDLPPYQTLEEFRGALLRFATSDVNRMARGLFRAWLQDRERRLPPARALTISDIRRARRATGLSLDDLAAVTEVPAARLRELEWGFFRHWRTDAETRGRIARYARAAGLDEELVLSIAWPMIEEAATAPVIEVEPIPGLVPAQPQALVPAVTPAPRHRVSKLASWALAATAALLLALATLAVGMESTSTAAPIQTQAGSVPVEPEVAVPDTPASAPAATPVRSTKSPASAAARQGSRTTPAQKRRAPGRMKSFFGRELFRIVIR
jgi:Helix-turn-helix domain